MTDQELGAYALRFVDTHAGISAAYDSNYDDPDERWTGPDSALLYAAAQALIKGERPIRVRSDWGSGTYRGWNDPVLKSKHDALVSEINRRVAI